MTDWLARALALAPSPGAWAKPAKPPKTPLGDVSKGGFAGFAGFAAGGPHGPASAVDAAPAPRPAPIPVFELQVAFETLVLASASDVPDDRARRDALAIFTAMIGNNARLVPPQPNPWRCVVCDEPGGEGAPLVPVLTPIEEEFRWLHLGCHDTFCRRQNEAVDELLKDAGLLQ